MSYYALTDSDWPWDDEGEGRAIVVKADTPEEAIKVATEKMRAEDPHDGGIGWKVARLNLVGFEGATWELGEEPVYDGFTYYSDGINGRPDAPPSSPQPASTALVEWQPIETAPHACHVIACYFYECEWIYDVVLSPPSPPFTHWKILPAPPALGGASHD